MAHVATKCAGQEYVSNFDVAVAVKATADEFGLGAFNVTGLLLWAGSFWACVCCVREEWTLDVGRWNG